MHPQHFKAAVKFGQQLIRTGDLDPVYIALTAIKGAELERTLLAYFFLYHLGAASLIAQNKEQLFWGKLYDAAANLDRSWPRGTERRHWRGVAAMSCVDWLRTRFDRPEAVLYNWYWEAKSSHFSHVSASIQQTPSCGPWIAFKVSDMLERCLKLKVDFSDCELNMYREPRAGAALLLYGDAERSCTGVDLEHVVNSLLKEFRGVKAPPDQDRPVALAEMETVLCKYKSHCNGHYPIGKDTAEVTHALSDPRWGRSAARMRKVLEAL